MVNKNIKDFQEKIWDFYKLNKRDFPWRQTSDPYKIFISEVMLQQTQATRVVPKYLLLLKEFPTFESLAASTNEDVLRLWSGLGYNRRALYLKRAAEIIIHKNSISTGLKPFHFGSRIESKHWEKTIWLRPEFLQTLPGIGPNTAGSIYVFSYNLPHVFIETNIRRVFIHEFFADREDITDKEILKLVKDSLDQKNPRNWYYALMDYGAFLGKLPTNPNLKSKHYTKQSKFEGSLRQTRGKILKILLHEKNITKEILENKVNSIHLEKALSQLEKEKFISNKNSIIKLV